jgi:regulatory protein YycI of two-component signal transduction system YycFG
LLLRFRPNKKITLSGTYDSRRNIIYFESDKNFLSTYIDNETRQGISFQANYNITQDIYTGARAGYRTSNNDTKPTKNVYIYISHSSLFHSSISTLLSLTKLETNYLNGDIYNVDLSRSFLKGKMNAGLGYRFVNYSIINRELPLKQHITNINLTTEIIKKLYFTFNVESNYEDTNHFYRLFFQLRKRF